MVEGQHRPADDIPLLRGIPNRESIRKFGLPGLGWVMTQRRSLRQKYGGQDIPSVFTLVRRHDQQVAPLGAQRYA